MRFIVWWAFVTMIYFCYSYNVCFVATMNFYRIITIIYVSVNFRINTSGGTPVNENDATSLAENTKVDAPVMEAIVAVIDQTLSRLLSEEKRPSDEADSSTLTQMQDRLRSKYKNNNAQELNASRTNLSPSSSVDAAIFRMIEESVNRNLKETLLQYSEKKADAREKDHSQTMVFGGVSQEVEKSSHSIAGASSTLNEETEKENEDSIETERSGQVIATSGSKEFDLRLMVAPRIKNTRVLTLLSILNVRPENFGVVSSFEFPSGATLFYFNSVEGRKEFSKLLERTDKFNLEMRRTSHPHSVRVMKLPSSLGADEVTEDITKQFGEEPSKVALVISPMSGDSSTMDAVVHVSTNLFDKIKADPRVQIRGRVYDIDTTLTVHRCFKCHLLGHTWRTCQSLPRPYPSADEDCLDCCNYNRLVGYRQRNVKHPTNHESCMTKKYFESLWQRRRENIEEADSQNSTTKLKNVESGERTSPVSKSPESYDEIDDENVVGDFDSQVQEDRREEETINIDGEAHSSENTLLIVPSNVRRLPVVTELAILGIDLAQFGVRRSVGFPSGAVLLVFDSTAMKEMLQKIVYQSRTLSVQSKTIRRLPPTVRLKNLSVAVSDHQVWSSIVDQFHESPLKLSYIPCEDHTIEHLVRTVQLHVTDTMLEKIKANPYVTIDGLQYYLDTSMHVTRCFKCKLLGHSARRCRYLSRPYPSPFEDCIDCTFYNFQTYSMNIPGRVWRAVNHPTGHDSCKTKQYYESVRYGRIFGEQAGAEESAKEQLDYANSKEYSRLYDGSEN